MNSLTIINHKGLLVTDSREVAEMVEKEHSNLLRDIRGYIDILNNPNSNLKAADFFIGSEYWDKQSQVRPCYLLTKKGCDMVANKMTGEKGVLFTATYVTKFEEMEETLKNPYKGLSKEIQAIFVIDKKTQEIETRVDNLEFNMPLFNIECKELQALVRKTGIKTLGGYKSPAYNDNSLRGKVYSDIQYQLKREFGVSRYEAIKRIQLETAKKITEEYKVPIVLADEIQLANNQVTYKEVII